VFFQLFTVNKLRNYIIIQIDTKSGDGFWGRKRLLIYCHFYCIIYGISLSILP